MMSYFVFEGILECGEQFELEGEEARHILKSRRLSSGEIFLIQDEKGQRFEAVLEEHQRKSLTFIPEKIVAVPPPSSLRLEIIQALPKEKALDFILQKTTELGISRLILFGGVRSPNAFRNAKKEAGLTRQIERWRRILWEACKQCGRQFPPEIFWHPDLANALKNLPENEPYRKNAWVLFPEAQNSVSWKKLAKTEKLPALHHRLLVGPEGGLDSGEIELALRSGMRSVNLGPRILRTETAAITAAAILQFLWGDLQ